MDLRVGEKYRFRFINITPNHTVFVSLIPDTSLVQWRAIAKDGADLPAIQAAVKPARQVISVGETYDFEYSLTSIGDLRLEVLKPKGSLPEFRMEAAVRVR